MGHVVYQYICEVNIRVKSRILTKSPCREHQIRSDDWVEALPSQRRLQFLSYVFFLVSSKNFYHHQVQLSGNFRLNLSIVIILSSFEVVFFSIWRIAILSFLQCPLY